MNHSICGLKGVDICGKKAYGAYDAMVKQDYKKLAKIHSFQGAKI
jgi:hypothetical protein